MNNNTGQSLEELASYYGWDETLIGLLRPLPRRVIDRYISETSAYDKDGWRYILPELTSSASILCLDTRFGNTAAAFAKIGASVTVIHPSSIIASIIQYRLASMNITNVKVMHVPPATNQLPFANESFDAFIYHNLAGALTTGDSGSTKFFTQLTPSLLNETFRLLKRDSFAYFGVKNRHGYDEIKKKLFSGSVSNEQSSHQIVSVNETIRRIKRAGFLNLQNYPYLIDRGRVVEILPATGYRSVRNSFFIIEKLKQIVLGKIGIRFFAPAYGLVCTKGRATRSCQIQNFIDDLVTRKILAKTPDKLPCFQRYLSQTGKIFVTLGKAADGQENIIIVIPSMPKVVAWRRKEIGIVNEVRSLSPYLASKVPRLYVESSQRGETYFALSEISGITVDREIPQLKRLTRNAVDFLIRFNQTTARAIVIDESKYADLIGALIKQTMDIYPPTREILERIEPRLRAVLLNKPLTTVWFHGDYKLENLILNESTLEISGIIDWEQSRREGLPWLDLLYLIAYNRIMVEHRDFFDIYHRVIAPQKLSNSEKSIVDSYASAMPVSPMMREVLVCLFFLHHICCRYKYNIDIEGDRRNIFHGLEEVEKRLAQLT